MSRPSVSIITPTHGREEFLSAIADCVRSQTYQDIEWLVLDDSAEPSVELSCHAWDRLHYMHSAERLTIGEKRNRLIDIAKGDVVVHFDDDDFYAPEYVSSVLASLVKEHSDVSLLTGFFVAHLDVDSIGYYRPSVKKGPAFHFGPKGVAPVKLENLNIPYIHLCYGWGYAYHKRVWKQFPFQQINQFEDREFVRAAARNFQIGSHEFEAVQCVHSVHSRSSSACYPQFNIPNFVLRALSPVAFKHVSRLRDVAAKRQLALR
jgi:glycosyltransferase involved in cell wall biosynthesis